MTVAEGRSGLHVVIEGEMAKLRKAYHATDGARAIKLEFGKLADNVRNYRVALQFSTQCPVEALASLEYVIGVRLAEHLATLADDYPAASAWIRSLERPMLNLLAGEQHVNQFGFRGDIEAGIFRSMDICE